MPRKTPKTKTEPDCPPGFVRLPLTRAIVPIGYGRSAASKAPTRTPDGEVPKPTKSTAAASIPANDAEPLRSAECPAHLVQLFQQRHRQLAALCEGIESRAFINDTALESVNKGLSLRVTLGVRWGLFAEIAGSALPLSKLTSVTDRAINDKRRAAGLSLDRSKRSSEVGRSKSLGTAPAQPLIRRRRAKGRGASVLSTRHIISGHGPLPEADRQLGWQAAAALRYMAAQRDSMSD